ncbi:MAG: hypothetical protein HY684_06825 [Chloroflexi bacterium]|nr:hypothetical protein [Chloroflexota bacterium]
MRGKAAGFRIQWSSFDVFMKRFEELLRERCQPRSVYIMDQNFESPNIAKKGLTVALPTFGGPQTVTRVIRAKKR